MQSLIKFIGKVFELNAPIDYLDLTYFSENIYEGKQVLKMLATSGISSIRFLDLRSLPAWFQEDQCV